MDPTTPQMVVMQATIKAAREAEEKLKEAQKRVGLTETDKTKGSAGTISKLDNHPFDKELYQYTGEAKTPN